MNESCVTTTIGMIECPFCYSFNTKLINRSSVIARYQTYGKEGLEEKRKEDYYVLCSDCKAQGPIKDTEEEAIIAWNAE